MSTSHRPAEGLPTVLHSGGPRRRRPGPLVGLQLRSADVRRARSRKHLLAQPRDDLRFHHGDHRRLPADGGRKLDRPAHRARALSGGPGWALVCRPSGRPRRHPGNDWRHGRSLFHPRPDDRGGHPDPSHAKQTKLPFPRPAAAAVGLRRPPPPAELRFAAAVLPANRPRRGGSDRRHPGDRDRPYRAALHPQRARRRPDPDEPGPQYGRHRQRPSGGGGRTLHEHRHRHGGGVLPRGSPRYGALDPLGASRTLSQPILWVLHIGHAWIGIGLFLKAASAAR